MLRKGARVLIFPAGWEQVPTIRRAKALGLTIVGVAPAPDWEGLAETDVQEVASSREMDRIKDLAQRHRVDAVVADQCDYALFAAAYVGACLGLPAPSLASAQVSTNKRLMRERCQAAGLSQPEFHPCRTPEEAEEAARRIDGPAIVKPTDNRGAIGVARANTPAEAARAFYDAVANAHAREVLVERFLAGTMVTVDGYWLDAGHYAVLGVASKRKIGGRHCVDMEVMYPAELDEGVVKRILDYNRQVVLALGLNFGATHGEYLVDREGEVFLIEIANRGGGVWTAPVLLPALSGVDVPELLIRNAFGEFVIPDGLSEIPRSDRAVVLSFLDFGRRGRLERIAGLEEARTTPGVQGVRLFVQPGQIMPAIADGPSRHGCIIAAGATRQEARAVVESAKAKIRLEISQ